MKASLWKNFGALAALRKIWLLAAAMDIDGGATGASSEGGTVDEAAQARELKRKEAKERAAEAIGAQLRVVHMEMGGKGRGE